MLNYRIPGSWPRFSQLVILGSNISEGISLELVAICGGVARCASKIYWGNVFIMADVPLQVPVPAAARLFSSALSGLTGMVRKKKGA